MNLPNRGLAITSTLTTAGALELELSDVPIVQPSADEVVVRVDAAPINPSDLLVLLASADPAEAQFGGSRERPRVKVPLSPKAFRAMARRIGLRLAIGLEGAGVVVAAGPNNATLLGNSVAALTLTGGMFAQYKTVRADECVVLPDGVDAEQGAAMFVNPLTALAIVETVRLDDHKALIHTAAASNLGQMLVKICREDRVPLVNIVRKQEHADRLRALGAQYVCNSSLPSFRDDLIAAIRETGATVAFDALGGGSMAGEVLAAIEAVADARATEYSLYGSFERKHVYVYGHLDRSDTQLRHENYGLVWGVSGWLMPPILARVGPERTAALRGRVVAQLATTFASHYTRKITLAEVLHRDVMLAYCRQATGEKFLITSGV